MRRSYDAIIREFWFDYRVSVVRSVDDWIVLSPSEFELPNAIFPACGFLRCDTVQDILRLSKKIARLRREKEVLV